MHYERQTKTVIGRIRCDGVLIDGFWCERLSFCGTDDNKTIVILYLSPLSIIAPGIAALRPFEALKTMQPDQIGFEDAFNEISTKSNIH